VSQSFVSNGVLGDCVSALLTTANCSPRAITASILSPGPHWSKSGKSGTPADITFGLGSSGTNNVAAHVECEPGESVYPSGTYAVTVDVTGTNMNLTLTEIYLCRRTSACGAVAVIGSLTGLTQALGNTGSTTHNIPVGASHNGAETDKLVVLLVGSNAAMSAQGAQIRVTAATPIAFPSLSLTFHVAETAVRSRETLRGARTRSRPLLEQVRSTETRSFSKGLTLVLLEAVYAVETTRRRIIGMTGVIAFRTNEAEHRWNEAAMTNEWDYSSVANLIVRVVVETFRSLEARFHLKGIFRAVAEAAVRPVDAIARSRALARHRTETQRSVEVPTRSRVMVRLRAEIQRAVEGLSRALALSRRVAEAVRSVESRLADITRLTVRVVSESVGLLWSSTRLRMRIAQLTESVRASESVQRLRGRARVFVERVEARETTGWFTKVMAFLTRKIIAVIG
jgi:hypothetical protein